jgi:hypothetical protein
VNPQLRRVLAEDDPVRRVRHVHQIDSKCGPSPASLGRARSRRCAPVAVSPRSCDRVRAAPARAADRRWTTTQLKRTRQRRGIARHSALDGDSRSPPRAYRRRVRMLFYAECSSGGSSAAVGDGDSALITKSDQTLVRAPCDTGRRWRSLGERIPMTRDKSSRTTAR